MSGANPTAGAGQAPTTSGGTDPGQAPQANNGGSPSTTPTSGQAPTGNPSSQQLTAADYDRIIAELRKENATHRTKLKQIEDAQAAADLAKLGDLEKAQKQLAAAEAANAAYKQRVATYAVQLEAQKLGIVDPELAALAIAGQLEFDENGSPKNADKLLKELILAKPYLVASSGSGAQGQGGQQNQQRPPAASGGATNPGAGARTGVITKAAYAAMSQQERINRNKEVLETLRQNGGRFPD